jgi:heptosyltransferase-1
LIFVLDDKRRHEYIDKISLLSPKIIITTGLTTLSEVSYLISKSDLFIGNDSGLFHIAKTYNKKRIGIVGGGALNITLPYCSGENEILLYKEMECFKCHWVCRFNHSYCIQDISVLDVFDSVKKLLKDE